MATEARAPVRVVGIGASAGGVDALSRLISTLPADFPHAILIVLHLPPTGRSLLASILDRLTPLHVATAQEGDVIEAGKVFVAPARRVPAVSAVVPV